MSLNAKFGFVFWFSDWMNLDWQHKFGSGLSVSSNSLNGVDVTAFRYADDSNFEYILFFFVRSPLSDYCLIVRAQQSIFTSTHVFTNFGLTDFTSRNTIPSSAFNVIEYISHFIFNTVFGLVNFELKIEVLPTFYVIALNFSLLLNCHFNSVFVPQCTRVGQSHWCYFIWMFYRSQRKSMEMKIASIQTMKISSIEFYLCLVYLWLIIDNIREHVMHAVVTLNTECISKRERGREIVRIINNSLLSYIDLTNTMNE